MRCSDCCVGEVAVMEIPLTLHEPVAVPPFFLAGLDMNDDDVPPSPTPDPATPTLPAGTFFKRGFMDCAQEALRFLVEEEGMPEDSPVVAGLKQHLLHTSCLAPSPGLPVSSSSSSVFTFPPATISDVITKKHHSNVSTSVGCAPSFMSGRVRFAPYTVPSCRRVGYNGSEVGKYSPQPEQNNGLQGAHRLPSSACTETQRLENVLRDGVISTDDLQGVLTCLQSVQSPVEHCRVADASAHLSQSSSQPISSCVSVLQEQKGSDADLNDSGFCEFSTTEQADEVDSGSHSVAVVHTDEKETVKLTDIAVNDSVLNNGSHTIVKDSTCVHVLTPGHNSPHELSVANDADRVTHLTSDIACPVTTAKSTLSVFNQSRSDNINSSPSDCVSLPEAASQVSVPTLTSPAQLSSNSDNGGTHSSNPASQLDLLSALSSGTHRVTAEEGNTTATRIQSLASQILLLLQEEAEAGVDSDLDDEVDEDEGEDDGDMSGFESDGEELMVEIEP